jgi:prepilin-type N-terminal cleavage/methylation domain-containing protein
MRRDSNGFTLIELMIVVVVIGILAAIGIPNYLRFYDHAKEGSVKSNMHTFQMAMEDYAVMNDGVYATVGEKAQIKALIPEGDWPLNPFTGARLADADVSFGSDPDASGEIGANPATASQYEIKGYGKSAILTLTLTNGS